MNEDFIREIIREKHFGDLVIALDDKIVKDALTADYCLCLSLIDEYIEKLGIDEEKLASVVEMILDKLNKEN